MTHREALEVLAAHRGQHLVITTHGSVDLWVSLSDTPLDFAYVPASMGQGPALGLGLVISRRLIEAHGGRLWATPNTGPGVTFQFTLPAGEEQVS